MPRILALDYGLKRTGVASTDNLQIIASPLETVDTANIFSYLLNYCAKESVEAIVVGEAKNLDGSDTHSSESIRVFKQKLITLFPKIKIESIDERFTSRIAFDSMLTAGAKKSERSKKENIDKLSATIILQDYLEKRNFLK